MVLIVRDVTYVGYGVVRTVDRIIRPAVTRPLTLWAQLWHSWPAYVARYYVRRLWDDLPGPAWVKVLLIIACLACPGPLDEIALVALPRACREWRKRRKARDHDDYDQ